MKLLLERLRDGELDYCIGEKAGEVLADEIEHYYIPRPRFEDGEPVQFGDEFIIDRYMTEPETLKRISIYNEELLKEWNQYHGLDRVYELNFCRPNCEDGKEPIIKRPQPKVLDADGIEIKVGDTVWRTSGNYPWRVDEITTDGRVGILDDDGLGDYADPKNLTHNEPILDADGVPIKVGDVVWSINSDKGGPVKKIKGDNIEVHCDSIPYTQGSHFYASPSQLTHNEPDSLEKLMDDATKPQRQYYNDFIGHDVGLCDDEEVNVAVHTHIINRAIAIERGA